MMIQVGDRVRVQNSFTRPGAYVIATVIAVETPYCKVQFTYEKKVRKQTNRIEDVKKA